MYAIRAIALPLVKSYSQFRVLDNHALISVLVQLIMASDPKKKFIDTIGYFTDKLRFLAIHSPIQGAIFTFNEERKQRC